jgi:LysR family transcriptional regulator, hydrogen peroxide-inducible genes activator
MELHQLRYFVAVARLRNFSRAAERCHVSQPSLSQQIMKLEGELGERLLERTKRKVALTDAGERFLEHAVRVADEVERARDAVRDTGSQVRGRVILGALPTIAPYYLPARLREFSARFPGIEVVVNEDTTARLARSVLENEIDLALVSLPLAEGQGFLAEKLFDEELLAVISAGHRLAARPKISLGDLKDERFILMHESHCLSGQALGFCRNHGVAPNVSFRSAQIETILAFVASGHGISLVPAMSRRETHFPGVLYKPLSGPGPRRDIALLRRFDRPLNRAARALVDYLKENRLPRARRSNPGGLRSA